MGKLSPLEIRYKLFDHYSAMLAAAKPEFAGYYGCPICLTGFPREAVEIQPGETAPRLTIEDVVPQGLGKRLLVLTCQKCNNHIGGSALDSHLHQQVKLSEFLSHGGTISIPANLEIGGSELAVQWTRTITDEHANNHFQVVGKATNPDAIAASEELMSTTPLEDLPEFRLTFKLWSEKRAKISQLKAGYLACFMGFGYEYILTPILDAVRSQIQQPDEDLVPADVMVLSITQSPVQNGLLIISEPAHLEAVAAIFTFKKSLHGSPHRGVILPSPSSPAGFYAEMARMKEAGDPPKFTGQTYLL